MDPSITGQLPPGDIEQEVRRLHDETAAGIFRYALAFCGSRESAQDAVQEAFLRYFVIRSAGEEIHAPKAWLIRVVRNHLLDELKAGGSRREVGLRELANSPDPRQYPDPLPAPLDSLWLTIESLLSPRELECLRLRAEGLQYAEIANVLGLRSGTVGALLARAHKKIRKFSKSKDWEEPALGLEPANGARWT